MKLLKRESDNLLSEIQRLEKQRQIQSDRLKNAIDLVCRSWYSPAVDLLMEYEQSYSTVNIEDSRSMQDLTKATMRDSAAMKQVSVNVGGLALWRLRTVTRFHT